MEQEKVLNPEEALNKDIEKQAFKFAQEESYGEFSGDLWKGFVFGAKWMKEKLKKDEQ